MISYVDILITMISTEGEKSHQNAHFCTCEDSLVRLVLRLLSICSLPPLVSKAEK